MLEYYIEQIEQHCAADVAAQIIALNVSQNEASDPIFRIARALFERDEAAAKQNFCMNAYVGFLSYSLSPDSPYSVVERYLDTTGDIHPVHVPSIQDAVAYAYSQIDATNANHGSYFNIAGAYQVELPPTLHARFSDVVFLSHTEEAFSYNSYLILMGDPKGIEGFAKSLAVAEPDVNAKIHLVNGLVTLERTLRVLGRDTSEVIRLLEPSREDTRRTIGVTGPGTGGSPQVAVEFLFRGLEQE